MKKANKTSFKPGRMAWNKSGRFKSCEQCKIDFWITPFDENHRPCKFCSLKCRYDYNYQNPSNKGKIGQVLELARSGMTHKEICLATGIPMGTICGYTNKANFRRVGWGTSYHTIVKKLKKDKCCLLCGFSRTVDACHIIPASRGGTLSEDNILILCPNHHRLFDNGKLNDEELLTIKLACPNYTQQKGASYARKK